MRNTCIKEMKKSRMFFQGNNFSGSNFYRESTEWCQFYWYGTENKKLPRVLLIGDSIIVGSAPKVEKNLKGIINVGFYATSKIVGDPAIYRELGLALSEYAPDLIYFNNGLHGREYDIEFYRRGLEQFVDYLSLTDKAKLIWRSSTPISIPGRPEELDPCFSGNSLVIERNEAASAIMLKHKIPIDDLYSLLVGHPEYSNGDGFHYNEKGWTFIAKHISTIIKKLSKKPRPEDRALP